MYAVFFRGINVGGKNKLVMAELKQVLTDEGFKNPASYLNSGNLIIEGACGDCSGIEERISSLVRERFGLQIDVIIRSREELAAIADAEPFGEIENNYVVILKQARGTDIGAAVDKMKQPDDMIVYGAREINLFVPGGFGKTKLTNSFFEKELGVSATTRNIKTVRKVLSMMI